MDLKHFTSEEDVAYVRVEDIGTVEHVVDLGLAATNASVDVVGETVIVVFDGRHDGDSGRGQYEINVSGGDPEAFMKNGVLTIRTEDIA